MIFELSSYLTLVGFPGGSDSEESACSAGDLGSIPESGRSPEEENDYPLQYSCLENSMHRETRWITYSPWGCKESGMMERLTLDSFIFIFLSFIFISWRLITLQYCSGFCHTLT